MSTTTHTLDVPTSKPGAPDLHVIRWHNPATNRDYVLVGLVDQVTGNYADLTHVIKFDALTAWVVARFDRLDEVATCAEVPGYRIPGDAGWWRTRWIRWERDANVTDVDHLALLDRLDEEGWS